MNKLKVLHYLKAFGYEFIDKNLHFSSSKENDFLELKQRIEACRLCQLSKKRQHSLIANKFEKTKLMILDSFASKSENESGILLNSMKGRKLLELLKEHLKLEAHDFYLAYVYKCFTSQNDAFALKQCLPYFWAEFKLCSPKILLILGKESFENIGFDEYESLKGELFSHQNTWVLPSFDVDFILKNPSFEKDFIKDLNKIKALL